MVHFLLFILFFSLCMFEIPTVPNIEAYRQRMISGEVVVKKTFPCYQDVHYYTEVMSYHSLKLRPRTRVTKEKLPPRPYVALVLRKLLLSKEHALSFTASLRTNTIAINKPLIDMMWYKCALCLQLHTVKIILYEA